MGGEGRAVSTDSNRRRIDLEHHLRASRHRGPHAGERYRIRSGDTLSGIAARIYGRGRGRYCDAIRAANTNTISDDFEVDPGTEIYLPSRAEADAHMLAPTDAIDLEAVVFDDEIDLSPQSNVSTGPQSQGPELLAYNLPNVSPPIRALSESILAELVEGRTGRGLLPDTLPRESELSRGISAYLMGHRGTDMVRGLRSATPQQVARACREIAEEFVEARFSQLRGSRQEELTGDLSVNIRNNLGRFVYQSLVDATREEAAGGAEAYIRLLGGLATPGSAENTVEQLIRESSAGRMEAAGMERALRGIGFSEDSAASWVRRIGELDVEGRTELCTEVRSSSRRLASLLRRHLAEPLRSMNNDQEARVGLLQTFRPVLDRVIAEGGTLGRVEGGDSFARLAFQTYHEHEQRSSYWRGHIDSILESGVSRVVLGALSVGGPIGIAAGIATGGVVMGLNHEERAEALTQAELAQLLGMASHAEVSRRRRDVAIGLASDGLGIVLGAGGDLFGSAEMFEYTARNVALMAGPDVVSEGVSHGTIALTGSDLWIDDSEPRGLSERPPATEARRIIRP